MANLNDSLKQKLQLQEKICGYLESKLTGTAQTETNSNMTNLYWKLIPENRENIQESPAYLSKNNIHSLNNLHLDHIKTFSTLKPLKQHPRNKENSSGFEIGISHA